MAFSGGGSRARKKARRAKDTRPSDVIRLHRATADLDTLTQRSEVQDFVQTMKAALRQSNKPGSYGFCENLREAGAMVKELKGPMRLRAHAIHLKVKRKYAAKCRRAT